MTSKALLLCSALLIALSVVSCDLGINPLLFDGIPLTAKFRVDAVATSYDTTATVNLENIRSDISAEIDSIKVFNVTLQIDSTAGTAAGTTVSGSALIDGTPLLTLSAAAISQFATERSIFDSTITGGPIFGSSGVAHLIAVLKSNPLPTVTLRAFGVASGSPLHFTIKLRLYTQVYTPPPK